MMMMMMMTTTTMMILQKTTEIHATCGLKQARFHRETVNQ
jgi:hypothetical protein